jgi:hypothetical protein
MDMGWNRGADSVAGGGISGSSASGKSDGSRPGGGRGSILILTLLLLTSLCVLLLSATETVLMDVKAERAFEVSVRRFYVAEAGLAHAQALCRFMKKGEDGKRSIPSADVPWERWVSYSGGEYFLVFRSLSGSDPGLPLGSRNKGILVQASARQSTNGETRIHMVLEDPPSCKPVAWWQPRD